MPGGQGQYFTPHPFFKSLVLGIYWVLSTRFYWMEKEESICFWNARATSKPNTVETVPAAMGYIHEDINKFCSSLNYHSSSFIIEAKILVLPLETIMTDCEMFVHPEQSDHGSFVKFILQFLNSATCGPSGFSKHVTFHEDMLAFRRRSVKQVRILWDFSLLSLCCRHNISFGGRQER